MAHIPAPAHATAPADANAVMLVWLPPPAVPLRVIVPPPGGALSRTRAQLIVQHLGHELDATSPGNYTSATGAVAVAALDGFLMHLGHTGANWLAGETEESLEWMDGTPGQVETPYAALYAVFRRNKVTPRQFAATFADRISALAEEFQITYRWGANRGVLDNNRRVSHPVADFCSALNAEERKIAATVGAAAIQTAVPKALLGDTTANLLHAPPVPTTDPLEELRRRLMGLRAE